MPGCRRRVTTGPPRAGRGLRGCGGQRSPGRGEVRLPGAAGPACEAGQAAGGAAGGGGAGERSGNIAGLQRGPPRWAAASSWSRTVRPWSWTTVSWAPRRCLARCRCSAGRRRLAGPGRRRSGRRRARQSSIGGGAGHSVGGTCRMLVPRLCWWLCSSSAGNCHVRAADGWLGRVRHSGFQGGAGIGAGQAGRRTRAPRQRGPRRWPGYGWPTGWRSR